MIFRPDFNIITSVHYGVTKLENEYGNVVATYDDGTEHIIGTVIGLPIRLAVDGNVSVENSKLVFS